ncbi:MAG: CYCYC family (seleno)protein, partial [Gemmatimonadales bacterium]
IRCQCGCAEQDGNYSLLSCFEAPDPMGRQCLICQGQARLVHRLHAAGKTLDEIRRGVDARYG